MMSQAEQYIDALVRKVSREVSADLSRYGQCRSFRDLYDVCDADTFLIEVGEKFGYPVSDPDWVLGEGEGIERDAIARVDAEVFDSHFALDATEHLVTEYVVRSFGNVTVHAGCVHLPWNDMLLMVDSEGDKIRVGAYKWIHDDDDDGMCEPCEAPFIWAEFGHEATAGQVIGFIDMLTDLP